ncbi:hypothetical protein [Streptomyces sp. bgisy091]|uniref:hypothetical protein n=1 Tax=Streptomyces sp. bgisy091 TaxID=3413778 RepID=UPI003D73E09A
MSLDLSNYELRWPTALFVAEGEHALHAAGPSWDERVTWLLTEALVGGTAVADFAAISAAAQLSNDPWVTSASRWGTAHKTQKDEQSAWLKELLARASELQHATAPRPYWPQRQGQRAASVFRAERSPRKDFARLISAFAEDGYLTEAFGAYCVDDHDDLPDASEIIEDRLGIADLWPLAWENWDEDTFYGLIEVFHDLVSRPRTRWHHSYSGCGWHHQEFHHGPARILYRWKVNRLLREAGIEYELAAEGEELGRLVAVTDDARSALVHRTLNDSAPGILGDVDHAIALFRRRDTSIENKRSAIVALARVLEERRALIKEHLGKDEGALFEIANRYDLRHRNAGQHGDYADAFLDWIFWWYLATIELTNQLIATRLAPQASSDESSATGPEDPFSHSSFRS